jgi:hypothetical protein
MRGVPNQHMTLDMFAKVLAWCAHYDKQGTQAQVFLHGVGETTLHPEFPEVIRMAREALPGCDIGIATNGVALTDAHCEVLAEHNVWLNVSLHRPEKAGIAVERARRFGVLKFTNNAPVEAANDWAGNVNWHVSPQRAMCPYLAEGWAYVLVDGRISTCCFDAACEGIIGHVDEVKRMDALTVAPFKLCKTCHLTVP